MKLSLQLDASRRPPKHNPVLKNAHVQKTLKLLELSIAQSIKSINDLKATTDRATLSLQYEANIFSNDMQRTVYNLQKIVIRTFQDGAFDPDLESAVKQFSQFAYSVQQRFNDDPEMLKNQLKENLSSIMLQARRLVQSVQGNKNQEYIHEIVGVVDDLLFAVQKIENRNKLEDHTPESLVMQTLKLRDALMDKHHSFRHVNLSVLRDIKHGVRQCCEKSLRIVKVLDETADNYSDDIKKVLLRASYGIMTDIAEIDKSLRCKNDVIALKCYSIIGITTACLELENLIELLKLKIGDEQVANNLYNLVALGVVNELAAGEQLLRHIEYARMQISDD